MGYYEAYLNGQKVSDHMLDPGWTTYSERVLYVVHDLTTLLNSGVNTAGFMVVNGWYIQLPPRFWGARNWRDFLTTGRPCVTAMILSTYSDGTTEDIGSHRPWQPTPGPELRNHNN